MHVPVYVHTFTCVYLYVLESNKASDLQRWLGSSREYFAGLLSDGETVTEQVWHSGASRGGALLLCSCSVPCACSGTCLGVFLGHACLTLGICVGSGRMGSADEWKWLIDPIVLSFQALDLPSEDLNPGLPRPHLGALSLLV